MSQSKIPMRMCVSCQSMKPKRELIRIVRTPEGAVELDFTGRKNGRGAYICRNKDCFDRLAKSAKRVERAFGVPLPAELLARLGEEYEHSEQ